MKTKSKQTQVSKRKQIIDKTRQEVIAKTEMSLLEYNTHFFELGCELAETKTSHHAELIRLPEYWKFFKLEFNLFEREVLRDVCMVVGEYSSSQIKYMNYIREMRYMLTDKYVDAAFYNFLKPI